MVPSMKYRLLGSTALVLALAVPSYVVLAEPSKDTVTSSPDISAGNSGRDGGQASLSSEPTEPPQALTRAYEHTKASLERAYEDSKQFLVDSAQGRGRAAQANASAQGERVDRSVTSGAAIGASGRGGTQDDPSSATPRAVPEVLASAYEKTKAFVKRAYEKTAEFLTQSTRSSKREQPSSVSGT
jgi:hypothetical protein